MSQKKIINRQSKVAEALFHTIKDRESINSMLKWLRISGDTIVLMRKYSSSKSKRPMESYHHIDEICNKQNK